jgi:proteic killer suppression protein
MTRDKETYFQREYKNGTMVVWRKAVERQLARLPARINEKFQAWVTDVGLIGIREARRRPGYHDELLHGQRQGQRSVRLSRSYRAIYVEQEGGTVLVEVIEVNKHGY